MKTLALITLVFLPGAFIATLFSTNMISFSSKGQEVWIYIVIAVPLTLILVIAYILWLRMKPRLYDRNSVVEAGYKITSKEKGDNGGKGSKQS